MILKSAGPTVNAHFFFNRCFGAGPGFDMKFDGYLSTQESGEQSLLKYIESGIAIVHEHLVGSVSHCQVTGDIVVLKPDIVQCIQGFLQSKLEFKHQQLEAVIEKDLVEEKTDSVSTGMSSSTNHKYGTAVPQMRVDAGG